MGDDFSAPMDDNNDPFTSRSEPVDPLTEEEGVDETTDGVSLYEEQEEDSDEAFFINDIIKTQYEEGLPY